MQILFMPPPITAAAARRQVGTEPCQARDETETHAMYNDSFSFSNGMHREWVAFMNAQRIASVYGVC